MSNRYGSACRRQMRVRHPRVLDRIGAARVARPDDGRVDELVDRLVGDQHLGVVHLHRDAVARHDVGDAHREHVRALLLEQRRALPLASRGLVALARRRLLVDLRFDGALADLHAHAVHRRARRRREHVDRLDRNATGVLEQLVHLHARDDPGDRHVGGRLLQRHALRPLRSPPRPARSGTAPGCDRSRAAPPAARTPRKRRCPSARRAGSAPCWD